MFLHSFTKPCVSFVYSFRMPQEEKLKEASKAALEAATDPLEKLRSHCLSSGYSGILSLGR